MDIFLKILQKNECGYSNEEPRAKAKVRGKFILIPKNCWDRLPYLGETIFNPIKSIKFYISGKFIGANYDWHNKKYHMGLELSLIHI